MINHVAVKLFLFGSVILVALMLGTPIESLLIRQRVIHRDLSFLERQHIKVMAHMSFSRNAKGI
jgi:hypothetical protein